jgi:hypothetical protein
MSNVTIETDAPAAVQPSEARPKKSTKGAKPTEKARAAKKATVAKKSAAKPVTDLRRVSDVTDPSHQKVTEGM